MAADQADSCPVPRDTHRTEPTQSHSDSAAQNLYNCAYDRNSGSAATSRDRDTNPLTKQDSAIGKDSDRLGANGLAADGPSGQVYGGSWDQTRRQFSDAFDRFRDTTKTAADKFFSAYGLRDTEYSGLIGDGQKSNDKASVKSGQERTAVSSDPKVEAQADKKIAGFNDANRDGDKGTLKREIDGRVEPAKLVNGEKGAEQVKLTDGQRDFTPGSTDLRRDQNELARKPSGQDQPVDKADLRDQRNFAPDAKGMDGKPLLTGAVMTSNEGGVTPVADKAADRVVAPAAVPPDAQKEKTEAKPPTEQERRETELKDAEKTLFSKDARVEDKLNAAQTLFDNGRDKVKVDDNGKQRSAHITVDDVNAKGDRIVSVIGSDDHGRSRAALLGVYREGKNGGDGHYEQQKDRRGRSVDWTPSRWNRNSSNSGLGYDEKAVNAREQAEKEPKVAPPAEHLKEAPQTEAEKKQDPPAEFQKKQDPPPAAELKEPPPTDQSKVAPPTEEAKKPVSPPSDVSVAPSQEQAKVVPPQEQAKVVGVPPQEEVKAVPPQEQAKVVGVPPQEEVKAVPPQEQAKVVGVPPQEEVKAVPPQEQAKVVGVPPQEEVKAVPPQEQAKVVGVPPQEEVKAVPPQEQSKVVPPQEQAKVVPPQEEVKVVPPQEQTKVVPPQEQQKAAPPAEQKEQTVVPPQEQQKVVPPAEPQQQKVVPPQEQQKVVPPAEPQQQKVVPPQEQQKVVAPAEEQKKQGLQQTDAKVVPPLELKKESPELVVKQPDPLTPPAPLEFKGVQPSGYTAGKGGAIEGGIYDMHDRLVRSTSDFFDKKTPSDYVSIAVDSNAHVKDGQKFYSPELDKRYAKDLAAKYPDMKPEDRHMWLRATDTGSAFNGTWSGKHSDKPSRVDIAVGSAKESSDISGRGPGKHDPADQITLQMMPETDRDRVAALAKTPTNPGHENVSGLDFGYRDDKGRAPTRMLDKDGHPMGPEQKPAKKHESDTPKPTHKHHQDQGVKHKAEAEPAAEALPKGIREAAAEPKKTDEQRKTEDWQKTNEVFKKLAEKRAAEQQALQKKGTPEAAPEIAPEQRAEAPPQSDAAVTGPESANKHADRAMFAASYLAHHRAEKAVTQGMIDNSTVPPTITDRRGNEKPAKFDEMAKQILPEGSTAKEQKSFGKALESQYREEQHIDPSEKNVTPKPGTQLIPDAQTLQKTIGAIPEKGDRQNASRGEVQSRIDSTVKADSDLRQKITELSTVTSRDKSVNDVAHRLIPGSGKANDAARADLAKALQGPEAGQFKEGEPLIKPGSYDKVRSSLEPKTTGAIDDHAKTAIKDDAHKPWADPHMLRSFAGAFPSLDKMNDKQFQSAVAETKQLLEKKFGDLSKLTVLLDAGHGGNDTGTTSKGVNESDSVKNVAKEATAVLRSMGINVVNTDESGVRDLPAGQRAGWLQEHYPDAKVRISLHCDDAGTADKAPEAYSDLRNSDSRAKQGASLGRHLVRFLDKGLGLSDNQAKVLDQGESQHTSLAMVSRQGAQSATLLELGNLGNEKFRAAMQDPKAVKAYGAGVAFGISSYLKWGANTTP